jgi:16S rRNA (cytidine1402-2'-O)-methyltransferase
MSSKILLFPNVLDEAAKTEAFLPASVFQAVSQIDALIAESEKGGRYFLRRFSFPPPKTFRDIPLFLLNEHSTDQDIDLLLKTLGTGKCWGLVSDGGLPCVADPGAKLVQKARQMGIAIEAFTGPSAITQALLLSGLSGQAFAFHGYLEKEQGKLTAQIQTLEKRSKAEKSTQIFIEAPYRNEKLFEHLLRTLQEETLLCVASDLTAASQEVRTQPVRAWKKGSIPTLDKRPTVFLFSSK